jgi:hypothetical protein
MGKERTVERITEWRPIAVRRIGRQRLRWEGDVREDLGRMKIRNWSKMAMGREKRKRIVRQAKTHKEVLRYEKKKEGRITIKRRRRIKKEKEKKKEEEKKNKKGG